MTPNCFSCGRGFAVGEEAWAYDWKVIEPSGLRVETRYRCDNCEEEGK